MARKMSHCIGNSLIRSQPRKQVSSVSSVKDQLDFTSFVNLQDGAKFEKGGLRSWIYQNFNAPYPSSRFSSPVWEGTYHTIPITCCKVNLRDTTIGKPLF